MRRAIHAPNIPVCSPSPPLPSSFPISPPPFPQRISKRVSLCREIAREVAGLAPYEHRILDMIKTGGAAADKRIYKFAKNRLGSHKRAVHKREDIKEVNSQQRARQAAH